MTQLCWIRRDIRLHDHHALSEALKNPGTYLAFIFDEHILSKLKNKKDFRLSFIMESLHELEEALQEKGSSLIVRYGKPEEEIPKIVEEFKIKNVFCNKDYEPYAKKRDDLVAKKLKTMNVGFHQFKDSVFFEKNEVLTNTGGLYKVFTPYKNKWLEKFETNNKEIPLYQTNLKNLAQWKNPHSLLKKDFYQVTGFEKTEPVLRGGTKAAQKLLKGFEKALDHYDEERNFPAKPGTSNLSVYIRHGVISIRDMLRFASEKKSTGAKTWVSELIWRDFYQMILDTYPHVVTGSFKRDYDKIKYIGSKKDFEAWCEGKTGFPIVDAAMRCLNETGMMHNRLRMIVASFLCKTLLVDWRWGEAYFAEKLLDFDLAANSGGWQWSSSSGCDAQPYFRIFNPYSQSEKFDPDGTFIRQWVPELAHLKGKDIHKPEPLLSPDYPRPIVSYETNRVRCLEMYSVVKADKQE